MTRKRSDSNAGLTRRELALLMPAAALADPASAADKASPIGVAWTDWQRLRAAMDAWAGDGADAHAEIEAELYALTKVLMGIPAEDPADIAIKLAVLLGLAPIECGDGKGFPWPELQQLLDDCRRLRR